MAVEFWDDFTRGVGCRVSLGPYESSHSFIDVTPLGRSIFVNFGINGTSINQKFESRELSFKILGKMLISIWNCLKFSEKLSQSGHSSGDKGEKYGKFYRYVVHKDKINTKCWIFCLLSPKLYSKFRDEEVKPFQRFSPHPWLSLQAKNQGPCTLTKAQCPDSQTCKSLFAT